jgi:hypothetical protein
MYFSVPSLWEAIIVASTWSILMMPMFDSSCIVMLLRLKKLCSNVIKG